MKKVTILAALMSIMTFVACKKEVPPPPEAPAAPAEAPAPPPAPAEAPLPPPPPEEKDGTTVKVGKDGVDVSTKTDDKKTTVTVKGDGAAVEVKK